MQSHLANASTKFFPIVGPQDFKEDVGIPAIFGKFQFSCQAIHSTLGAQKRMEIYAKQ